MEATKKRAEKLQAKGRAVDFKKLLRMEPDGGTTNIRNVKSKQRTRWLGVENRCVVPFNSFSEFNKGDGGDIWFALDETRPLACFAGIWTNWTSVRKVKTFAPSASRRCTVPKCRRRPVGSLGFGERPHPKLTYRWQLGMMALFTRYPGIDSPRCPVQHRRRTG